LTAATPVKRRGEVRGSTKKIRNQKGGGVARLGDSRSPMLKGGGKSHGPRARSFEYDMPRKVKQMALKSVLTAKMLEGNLIIVDQASLPDAKTRLLATALRERGLANSTLIIDGPWIEMDRNFALASRNLLVDFIQARSVGAYNVLHKQNVVITLNGLRHLTQRLLGGELQEPFEWEPEHPGALSFDDDAAFREFIEEMEFEHDADVADSDSNKQA
jgi:large subunit ribosomal protein L4